MSAGPFFGKYRATVRNNLDPLLIGRVLVEVPDVGGNLLSSWALPCLPGAGPNMGLFTVPPVGAGVWVEFERGDPDHPIWVGGYYSEADVPVLARLVAPGTNGMGSLQQGFLETSNVNVVEELVSMIQTQRAYELNSKAVSTSDQMLQRLAQL